MWQSEEMLPGASHGAWGRRVGHALERHGDTHICMQGDSGSSRCLPAGGQLGQLVAQGQHVGDGQQRARAVLGGAKRG